MKFKEYIENLKKFAEENPETLELDVIYSKDDEGNGFNLVHVNQPTTGIFDGEYNGEFLSCEEDFEEMRADGEEVKINAICIN